MVAYDLSHLTQQESQEVLGPVQDDEALFLYALIRVTKIRRVLEIGGLGGYSARNFCVAVGNHGIVYTVDLNPVPRLPRTTEQSKRMRGC
jgi:predicted O-methyltransferase YrrM